MAPSIRNWRSPGSASRTWKVRFDRRFLSTHHPDPSYQSNAAMKRRRLMKTSTDVTVEDIEAYRRTRQKADDPMANISSDTLLDE